MDMVPSLIKKIPTGRGTKFADICNYLLKSHAIDNELNFTPFDDSSGDPLGVDSISKPNAKGISFEGQNQNVGFAYSFTPQSSRRLWEKVKRDCLKANKKYTLNQISLLIIILPENLQMKKFEAFTKNIKRLELNFEVKFWGHKDLWIFMVRYPEMVSDFYPELSPQNDLRFVRQILIEICFTCHIFKNDYVFSYPELFKNENGVRYMDVWDQMEKVTKHVYSFENWKKYKSLFDNTLKRIIKKLKDIDAAYGVKIPDKIRATMIIVMRQLDIEVQRYLSIPQIIYILPNESKDEIINVRIKEAIRVLAMLDKRSGEKREILDKSIYVNVKN